MEQEREVYFTTWHIIYIAIVIPTVFGNGFILYSVIKYQSLRGKMHILIANLAVSDLIVGAVLIPLDFLADIFNWKTNKYACLSSLLLFVLSLGSSCYNLLIISIERFVVIKYPFSARTILSKPRFAFMICFGWTVCIINISLPLYAFDDNNNNNNNNNTNYTECVNTNMWSKAYQTYLDWMLIFALMLNALLYIIVMRIALKKKHSNTIADGLYHVHVRAQRDIYQLITMVIILGLFLLCWLPYASFGVIVTISDTEQNQFIKRCTLIPGLFNSGINWIIYGYRNKEYRKAFKKSLTIFHRKISIGMSVQLKHRLFGSA